MRFHACILARYPKNISFGMIFGIFAQTFSMKYFLSWSFIAIIFLSNCHHHTVPSNTTTATINNSLNTATATINNSSNTAPASIYTKPIVIVDAHGNIVVAEKDLPPYADKSILNIENARGYTPEQTKNLAYRYKYVPPKIMYVPDALTKTSNRGIYYIYKTKFWYWKKQNGYFYLDETYYN